MKRYRYGNNFTTFNEAKCQQLLPLGYMEVVPGDTISGSVVHNVISDVTKRALLGRCYFDTAAFYVPYRLLWEGFPDWILSNGGVGSLPTVANAFKQNFEPRGTVHPAWFRYAYNLIYGRFWRSHTVPWNGDLTPAIIQNTEYRKSTFMESLVPSVGVESTPVPVEGDTLGGYFVDVDELRKGFARDRIAKLRGFYGQKYTDYLASIGIEASWSILDEPEVIGRKASQMKFRKSRSSFQADAYTPGTSTNSPLGAPGGYYEARVKTPLRRTFVPEHGLLVVLGTMRMERYNVLTEHPVNLKTNDRWDLYYNPENEYEKAVVWPSALLGDNTAGIEIAMPPYEDIRKGTNLICTSANTDLDKRYLPLYSEQDPATIYQYTRPDPADFDGYFQGYLPGSQHYQAINEWRVVRNSPVRPDPRPGGVA